MGKRKAEQAAQAVAAASSGSEDEDDVGQTSFMHPKVAKLEKKRVTNKWINRQRVLVLCSRGVSYRARHLMQDMNALLPHSKKESKLDRKDKIGEILPEICELKNCNGCLYFEMRKKQDCYLWISKVPRGPSCKFLVENIHTLDELRLTGNALKGSRPLLHFDAAFDSRPELQLYKELFFQIFATPKNHPKSKPFVDRVMSFFYLDKRIWIRNYQITWSDLGKAKDNPDTTLTEIGPRLVLNPIRIFEGTFGGPTLFQNTDYVPPNEMRAAARAKASMRYKERVEQREGRREHLSNIPETEDPLESVFDAPEEDDVQDEQ